MLCGILSSGWNQFYPPVMVVYLLGSGYYKDDSVGTTLYVLNTTRYNNIINIFQLKININ